jgi:hypothetical protein
MSAKRSQRLNAQLHRWNDRLLRPLSEPWLIFGWIAISIFFIALIEFLGGPTTQDSDVTVFTAWSLGHGHMACAYLPQGVLGYPPTAPIYPLFSAGISALFQVGHRLPFPTSTQLGPHCVTATATIYQWAFHSGAFAPTLRIGYIGWFVLATGFVAFLRAAGRGHSGWELVGLFLLACLPPVSMCLAEYFHPQDLVGMGLLLAALACVLRQRWICTGILFGLAISTQQFAILVFIPLLAMTPKGRLSRLVLAAVGAAALIDVPLALLSSGRAIVGIFVGTGASSYLNTLLDLMHLHGSDLYAVSRGVPLLLALVLGWYAALRLGPDALKPVPLASVMATALCLRLVFEVNFWGYYMMGVAVLLAALDIARGRIRRTFAIWLLAILFVSLKGGLTNPPWPSWLQVWTWQVVFVPSALALAITPLIGIVRQHRKSPPESAIPPIQAAAN